MNNMENDIDSYASVRWTQNVDWIIDTGQWISEVITVNQIFRIKT